MTNSVHLTYCLQCSWQSITDNWENPNPLNPGDNRSFPFPQHPPEPNQTKPSPPPPPPSPCCRTATAAEEVATTGSANPPEPALLVAVGQQRVWVCWGGTLDQMWNQTEESLACCEEEEEMVRCHRDDQHDIVDDGQHAGHHDEQERGVPLSPRWKTCTCCSRKRLCQPLLSWADASIFNL